jgi:hypothetical protein
MKKMIWILILLISNITFAQTTNALTKFGKVITTEGLKQKLSIIASAEMEGRETGTQGEKRAAAYIESEFKRMGLQPGNGQSYQQVFPVYQDALVEKKLVVAGKTFEWDKDFNFSLQGIATGNWNFTEVVFAGYGIVDPSKNINDYENLEVKGKLVVVLDGGGSAPAAAAGGRSMFNNPTSSYAKTRTASTKGAAGIIIVSPDFPKKSPSETKGGMYFKANTTAAGFLSATISPEVAANITPIVSTGKLTVADFKDIKKANYPVAMNIAAKKVTENVESSNVIGIIPGTEKKEEYVMQIAEAFAAAAKKGKQPRRTIVFMTVSGEEKGLWGSEYYSEHPIFPLDKTTVDLNIDMVGRVDTERLTADSLNYVYVIGHDKLSTDLPVINEAANKASSNITLDYKFDDPNDKNRIYYRSDHYNFARKGVPILFFYDGMLQSDYHKPTDTIEKINFDLMQKRVLMIYHTACEMIQREDMLKRDLKLNMPGR